MLGLNWIDLAIVIVVAFHVYDGWGRGFIVTLFDWVGLVISFVVALRGYGYLGGFLIDKFGITYTGWAKLLAFMGLAVGVGFVAEEILGSISLRLPQRWHNSRWNLWLGIMPSVAKGLVISGFVLLMILGLPIKGTAKEDIHNSAIGERLARMAQKIEGKTKSIFEDAIEDTKKFLTIKPDSKERVNLNSDVSGVVLMVDKESESRMLELVNEERGKAGLKMLAVNSALTDAARKYAKELWEGRYFSHTSLDGRTPADRVRTVGVKFAVVGENLALAPDVEEAHKGLMNSSEHKDNILFDEFARVGIGVVDAGANGKIFVQDFTD